MHWATGEIKYVVLDVVKWPDRRAEISFERKKEAFRRNAIEFWRQDSKILYRVKLIPILKEYIAYLFKDENIQ